jgi:3-oxoacyl-[acyl-carrier-protein] synthase I
LEKQVVAFKKLKTKMPDAYLVADSIVSPLGVGTKVHWQKMADGNSGISLTNRVDIRLKDFYSSHLTTSDWDNLKPGLPQDVVFTQLETLMLAALRDAESESPISFSSPDTVFVISTTKGNVDLLDKIPSNNEKLLLSNLASTISRFFDNPNVPMVISNACISGVSAIVFGKNLLSHNKAKQVVVCGADIISEFTVSGFNCLHAISSFPCKPFDRERAGLSPGEACGVLVLASEPNGDAHVKVAGGASSSDANHISGPSRTGDGLAIAISKAMKIAGITSEEVDYICTHGTATLYNDESESKALALVGLNMVDANSLKGYFGHTFGAAGVIETIISAQSIRKSQILPSLGYEHNGVSTEMNIVTKLINKNIRHVLKTASGFGSCNASLVLSA